MIAPAVNDVKPVLTWLNNHGISVIDVSGRDFAVVVTRVEIIEKLFQTELYYFQSSQGTFPLCLNAGINNCLIFFNQELL